MSAELAETEHGTLIHTSGGRLGEENTYRIDAS
jgi:hypothetical protein